MPEWHLSAPKRKQQVSNLLFFKLYLFFYEIRPFPPLILLGLSVYARRSLGRIFAIAQMRTTAKHGFAAYSLEDSLQKENSRSKTCLYLSNFFKEIRPFPPLILLGLSVFVRRSLGWIFAVAQMRTTAKHGFAAYSLEDSLQKENSRSLTCCFLFGAGNEIRTRDICLGKATLYH